MKFISTIKRSYHSITYGSNRRPFFGALCVLLAGLLVMWEPISLLQSSYIPAGTLRGGIEVGGLLFAMGLVQLLAPSYALVAGALGVVFSILSLTTSLGGEFGIGMVLGIIGNSAAIAWQAKRSRRVFWLVLGCSLMIVVGMVTLIVGGKLAVAAPIAHPYTVTVGRSECHNVHTVPAISSVDHHTPVILFRADMCINSRVVITQSVLFGHMITITEVSETSQGITSEITSQSSAMNHSSNASHSAANGFTTDIETSIDTNVTIHALFNSTESDVVSGISISIS
ncbi:MAG TPA: DUF6114 domain-containing protein [Ktedonobacteraceae bacterium]|nr:DUF6114 domain-containing protein [Ktedonobacteraceae bacterium]